MSFELHPRLRQDTFPVGDLSLSRVLLMDDARFPWVMLVPRRPAASQITDLSADDRTTLMEETAALSSALQRATGALRVNVGVLGNIVPQLHVHVVARFASDAAWPGPVWGRGVREPYDGAAGAAFAARIAQDLSS